MIKGPFLDFPVAAWNWVATPMNAKNYKNPKGGVTRAFSCSPFFALYLRYFTETLAAQKLITHWSAFLLLLFCPLITLSTLLLLNCCGCQKLEENPLLHCKIFEFETLKRKKSLLLNQAYALVAFSYYYFPAVVLIKSGGREACNNPAYWEKTCDKTIGLVEGSFSAEGM